MAAFVVVVVDFKRLVQVDFCILWENRNVYFQRQSAISTQLCVFTSSVIETTFNYHITEFVIFAN